MIKSTTVLLTCFFISHLFIGQVKIDRNFNIELVENDSLKSEKLEQSLNAFLTEALQGDFSEKYVEPIQLDKYEFFYTKISGIGKKSTNFHPPSVLKSYSPDGEIFYLTVVFSGVKDGKPFIYQITELKAIPFEEHYRFYCTFEENTSDFKTKKIDDVTYFYSGDINEVKAKQFVKFKAKLSEMTNTENTTLDYYCFQSLDELLKSYGFLYSARQCNFLYYDLGFTDYLGRVYVTGTKNENYEFGFVGDFLYYNLENKDDIYWPFVQGVSTYFGGYGLSYESIDKLKELFREEQKRNPKINFLDEFEKGRNSAVNHHFSYYVMSAFICEEVMKKKDFNEVLKLVVSGENGEHFFEKLKEILGIDKARFHQMIVELIQE